LLTLEDQLLGSRVASSAARRAADASAELIERHASWLPEIHSLLTTADGSWYLAPVERLSSALQGALMMRESPRRRADGCETGDWSHVDAYLTDALDYRSVVFTGSRYDAAAAERMIASRSTSIAVGGTLSGASFEVRYPGEDDTAVALLTEILVAELLAAKHCLGSDDVLADPPTFP
jgi:glutamine---fructose-6-phosphate transaminase (isomerizing)